MNSSVIGVPGRFVGAVGLSSPHPKAHRREQAGKESADSSSGANDVDGERGRRGQVAEIGNAHAVDPRRVPTRQLRSSRRRRLAEGRSPCSRCRAGRRGRSPMMAVDAAPDSVRLMQEQRDVAGHRHGKRVEARPQQTDRAGERLDRDWLGRGGVGRRGMKTRRRYRRRDGRQKDHEGKDAQHGAPAGARTLPSRSTLSTSRTAPQVCHLPARDVPGQRHPARPDARYRNERVTGRAPAWVHEA